MVEIPSPAIAVVGRHNSGKTTLVVKVISELVARGLDVGSVKHHTHGDFEIDYPGKDSFRHRAAGATETVIASPVKMARVKTLAREEECADIVRSMPGHDIVIVEGYRKSGLPTIEVMRSGNERDAAVAKAFAERVKERHPEQAKASQQRPERIDNLQRHPKRAEALQQRHPERSEAKSRDLAATTQDGINRAFLQRDPSTSVANAPSAQDDATEKMPGAATVAVVTDIDAAAEAAGVLGLPVFGLEDVDGICDFLIKHYTRPKVSVVIQAGGESRRMGRSKALVPFCGRPLICHMIERVRDVADELIITTNEADRLAFLAEKYPELGIRLVPDRWNFRGALPGLGTALTAATNDIVAVIACDMVFASAELIVAETNEMARTGADVVVPVNKHGFEPFHAAYRRSACLPAIERAIGTGSRRAQALFDDDAVRVLEFPQWRVLEVEPRGGCFVNTNTPEELARIEEDMLLN